MRKVIVLALAAVALTGGARAAVAAESKVSRALNDCIVDVGVYVQSTLGRFERDPYVRNVILKCAPQMVEYQAMYGDESTARTVISWAQYKERERDGKN